MKAGLFLAFSVVVIFFFVKLEHDGGVETCINLLHFKNNRLEVQFQVKQMNLVRSC